MISIGIPAYNAEKYLALTLDSVRAQTVSDWECIIVNDGSKDSTPKIARDYAALDARFRVIDKTNGGLPAARDTLFENMNPASEYISFLDADDLWEPEFLEILSAALDADPKASGVHAIARYIDGDGKPNPPNSLEKWCRERHRIVNNRDEIVRPDEPTDYAVLAYWTVLPTPGVILFRRSNFEQAGVWDKNTPECADWDMALRVSRNGYFVYVEKILLNYRQHGGNMSGNAKKMRQAELYVRRKVLHSEEFTPEQREMINRGFQLYERSRCFAKLNGAREDLARLKPRKAVFEVLRAMNNFRYSLTGIPK